MNVGFPPVRHHAGPRFGNVNNQRFEPPNKAELAKSITPVDEKFAELAGKMLEAKLARVKSSKTRFENMAYKLVVFPKSNHAFVSVTEFRFEDGKRMMKELVTDNLELYREFSDKVQYRFYPLGRLKTKQPLLVDLVPDLPTIKPLTNDETAVTAAEETKTEDEKPAPKKGDDILDL